MKLVKTLGCIIENPVNISFDTYGETEKIIFVLRKHWFTWLKWLIPSILALFLPFIVYPFLKTLGFQMAWGIIISLILLWETGVIFFVFQNFIIWFYSVDIVTDQRIVDMNFVFPFYKKESQLFLARIQDVSDVTNGFFQSLLNFGDLRLETAGETGETKIILSPVTEGPPEKLGAELPDFVFESIPDVAYVQEKIMELSSKIKQDLKSQNI